MPAFLYIEDDVLSQEIMRVLMVDVLGFSQLMIFDDSANIVEKMRHLSPLPDVIFLDIHIKPWNGIDVLKMIRQHSPYASIPVVALTASVMNEEVQVLKEAGFNGAVAKPIDTDTFPDVLQQILRGEEIWRIS